MKKDKILTIILIIVGMLILGESYNIIRTLNTKNEVLEDIKSVDVLNNNDKSLAILIQNEEFGWDESEDRSKWPSKEEYLYVGAECTDSEGTEVPRTDVLTFDEATYTAHIKTKQTIYCTLYFAKGKKPLEVLKAHATGGEGKVTFTETNVDGLYRYKGTYEEVTNNYICFETTSLDDCTKEGKNYRDKYLYRIIGITNSSINKNLGLQEGQLKVIRAVELPSKVKFNASAQNKITPPGSATSTLYSEYYKNVNSGWKKLISSPYWFKSEGYNTSYSIYSERGEVGGQSEVFLMYATDVLNSCDSGSRSWLGLSYGYTGVAASSGGEWTASIPNDLCGRYWDVACSAYYNESYGSLGAEDYRTEKAVRPVLYIDPNIGLVGEGTELNPFIITSMAYA